MEIVLLCCIFVGACCYGFISAVSRSSKSPVHSEVWLEMKDSGKSHRFYVAEGLNPYYKYSVCGFETTADKVKAEGEDTTRCKRCLLMKG